MGTASPYLAEPEAPINRRLASGRTRNQQLVMPAGDRSSGNGPAVELTLLNPETISAMDCGSGCARTVIVAPRRGNVIASRRVMPELPGQPAPKVLWEPARKTAMVRMLPAVTCAKDRPGGSTGTLHWP